MDVESQRLEVSDFVVEFRAPPVMLGILSHKRQVRWSFIKSIESKNLGHVRQA